MILALVYYLNTLSSKGSCSLLADDNFVYEKGAKRINNNTFHELSRILRKTTFSRFVRDVPVWLHIVLKRAETFRTSSGALSAKTFSCNAMHTVQCNYAFASQQSFRLHCTLQCAAIYVPAKCCFIPCSSDGSEVWNYANLQTELAQKSVQWTFFAGT